MKSFGQEFRRIRREKKLTLREIGEHVGKSIGYLSDVEHDRKGPPELGVVEKIEKVLGIKNNHLVNLAATLRKVSPTSVNQRIRVRPILSEFLMRVDEEFDSDEELENLLTTLIEEKRRKG